MSGSRDRDQNGDDFDQEIDQSDGDLEAPDVARDERSLPTSRSQHVSGVLSDHRLWVESKGRRGYPADLTNAELVGADFRNLDLRSASFRGAVLWEADLSGCNLADADFSGANLRGASLRDASLRNASLENAVLIGVDLTGAHLGGASLLGSNCQHIQLGATVLANIDLTPLVMGQPRHRGASLIDHRALARSLHVKRLQEFMVATGMPRMLATYMVDCVRADSAQGGVVSMMQSTFISYGGPDEEFAEKLTEALSAAGVTTFFFRDDAIPGQKLHRTMREGVNSYDRIVLICSKDSLDRPGVLNEIEESLAREARDGGAEYLIPIALDGYIWAEWDPENKGIKQTICDRVVGDFKGAKSDERVFVAGVDKLLRALTKVKIPSGKLYIPDD